jgi:hypothetical protein
MTMLPGERTPGESAALAPTPRANGRLAAESAIPIPWTQCGNMGISTVFGRLRGASFP